MFYDAFPCVFSRKTDKRLNNYYSAFKNTAHKGGIDAKYTVLLIKRSEESHKTTETNYNKLIKRVYYKTLIFKICVYLNIYI